LLFTEQADGGVFGDGGAGLIYFLLSDQDAAGKDQGAGAFTTGNESALHEEQVEAHFVCRGLFSQFLLLDGSVKWRLRELRLVLSLAPSFVLSAAG
jgi:hypothetical protein